MDEHTTTNAPAPHHHRQPSKDLPHRYVTPTNTSPSPHMAPHAAVLDEGYSGEETRSQPDSQADSMLYHTGDAAAIPTLEQVLDMISRLPPEQRRPLVAQVITWLPNHEKEMIGALCESLTHFDPTSYLPAELMLGVLSFLQPKDLLTCGAVSRPWRERALDEKLWRSCFAQEGWVLDREKLDAVEERARRWGRRVAERGSVGGFGGQTELERRGSRKRKMVEAFSGEEMMGGGSGAGEDVGSMAGNVSHASEEEDGMEGVEFNTDRTMSPAEALLDSGHHNDSSRRSSASDSAMSLHSPNIPPTTPADLHLRIKPNLWRHNPNEHKLSWPYLYKQRCRLEKNWETGTAKMFQLPLPEYAYEGHGECVYTIQHTSRHLVSGSRDRTIRIWDLNTLRLKGEPLRGHDASVLCLQFDERPEHDIIVSGGSDAYVIIWRFSTGEIIKKMTSAHNESVLNLRFDDRYIVTCSKDKSIKIWNRRQLHRSDPLVPQAILPSLDQLLDKNGMIAEFSLLTTLTGHQAAVNAVQILDDTIISASGDRVIKRWSIQEGRQTKTYTGHIKGIACVQFDGRRIVSGSSDNTVRMFDVQTGAEVACLTGHNNLVRTVQARFGDLDTVTSAELEEEAGKVDRDFYRALNAGMRHPGSHRNTITTNSTTAITTSSRNTGNAGSSRPEDVQAVGTKVPPGGGGSRWAKIVSGSYDETVVIWKRDRDGKWVVKQTLNQDAILRESPRRRRLVAAAQPPPAAPQQQNASGHVNAVQAGMQAAQQAFQQTHAHLAQVNNAVGTGNGAGAANGQAFIAALNNHAAAAAPPLLANGNAAQAPGNAAVLSGLFAGGANAAANAPAQIHPAAQPQPQFQPQAQAAQPHAPQQLPPQPQLQPQVQTYVGQPAANVHAAHPAHPHNANAANGGHRESNRVFKLQFDARRIICCSQNKVIVGWDFANGERELERVGGWSVETA